MRIGLVIERLDPSRGGAESWTWQFARGLLARGFEVHAVARQFGSAVCKSAVTAHQLTPAGSRTDFATAAEERLRQLALDVVHDMGAGWYCDVFQPHGGSRRAAFEQNLLLVPRPLRVIKRYAAPRLPRYREFARLTARQYAEDGRLYVALSRMVAKHMRTWHHIRPEQIRLVYNGVDANRFSPKLRHGKGAQIRRSLGLGDRDVLLMTVAHNFRLKGVATSIDAVGRLRQKGLPVRLAVVGGGSKRNQTRLARRAGALGAVMFTGPVADAAPYYAAADIYVHPTYYDPCSLVVLEALASGLPVVTSRFNGAGELLTPGVEGDLIDNPGDADALARCLEPLLEPHRRRMMGAAARRLALAHSFDRNCDEIVALYDEIVARRKAA